MKGKNKCKILKQIRQRIADENDIPYVTRECTYQGECSGTCPKCEAELRYLEQELEKRRRLGRSVAVAAVAAGLSLTLAACQPRPGGGAAAGGGETVRTQPVQTDGSDVHQVVGLVTADPNCTEPTYEPLEGEPEVLPTDQTETFMELEGDVVFLPEPEPTASDTAADPSAQGGANDG